METKPGICKLTFTCFRAHFVTEEILLEDTGGFACVIEASCRWEEKKN